MRRAFRAGDVVELELPIARFSSPDPRIDAVRERHLEIGPWPYGDEVDAAPVGASVQEVALVPYHDWAEPGPSTIRVWIPV